MSETFTELFTELPTDLQRVVYQHLFSYCLEEINVYDEKYECEECGGCRQNVGKVIEYTDHMGELQTWFDKEVICDKMCRSCFNEWFSEQEPDDDFVGVATWHKWEATHTRYNMCKRCKKDITQNDIKKGRGVYETYQYGSLEYLEITADLFCFDCSLDLSELYGGCYECMCDKSRMHCGKDEDEDNE